MGHMHFLMENTEGRFALKYKETSRAPRELRCALQQIPWMLANQMSQFLLLFIQTVYKMSRFILRGDLGSHVMYF
jgi:hypothetical protein